MSHNSGKMSKCDKSIERLCLRMAWCDCS